ncbi:MAG: hypothetical protein A3K10_11070 [Bacteroidetes bacterium RIFCSPLOWO2_12_FULL_31_6]|nr:MAG: hypothetical protein A3K10_11070 [Bacteroidetes bacterium RIFCSPLOWO2_12_FULL_31_6]
MKKLLVIAIILGGAIAFTSCSKKECVCTVGGVETTYTEDDMGSGDIEEGCDALDALYKIFSASDGCSMS